MIRALNEHDIMLDFTLMTSESDIVKALDVTVNPASYSPPPRRWGAMFPSQLVTNLNYIKI